MDASTGTIIASGNPDSQIEPASMTKVMSAYVIADQLKQKLVSFNDLILVSEKAWKMEGSRTFIEVGKKVPLIDLLRGLVIQSGNDATVALAESVGSAASYIFINPITHTIRGLEISANHVRSAKKGNIYATAKPIHIGKKTHLWEIKVIDENDMLISHCKLTNIVIEKK